MFNQIASKVSRLLQRLDTGTTSLSTEAKPSLVSISWFIPFKGIDHAGGEYFRQHLRVLDEDYDVQLFVPQIPQNDRSLLTADPTGITIVELGGTVLAKRGMGILRKALSFAKGASFGSDFELAARRNEQLKLSLKRTEIVEFQWIESASISRWVRRHSPKAIQILIVHDVISQRWQREIADVSISWRRFAMSMQKWLAERAETSAFRGVDHIAAFSLKDIELIESRGGAGKTFLVNPPLMSDLMPNSPILRPVQSSPKVLFVGAMNRPENDEGVRWFLENVWHLVRIKLPEASFIICGSKPSVQLIELAKDIPNVSVTGFVKELDPFYKIADLVVVPLFKGAGMKFKTATAMLWSIPVVATPIGAEGVATPDSYIRITENPALFSEAVILGLTDLSERTRSTGSASHWSNQRFDPAVFANALKARYANAVVVARESHMR